MSVSAKNNSKQLRNEMVDMPVSAASTIMMSKDECWKAVYHKLNLFVLPFANCKQVYLRAVLDESIT